MAPVETIVSWRIVDSCTGCAEITIPVLDHSRKRMIYDPYDQYFFWAYPRLYVKARPSHLRS